MAEILKDRSELDPQFQWDLTPMYESDAAWEAALESLDADIESLSAFAGKLSDAVTIGAYLDASTEVSRKVERLYCYASQRHDEDTRDDAAQSMYARVGSKYVKMVTALSFAQPEILSLPEDKLAAIVNDPAVAEYKFNLEDLLRSKPHTLTKAEESCWPASARSCPRRLRSTTISRMPTWCLMQSRTGRGRPWRSPAPTLCRLR